MHNKRFHRRSDLIQIANASMIERGLEPEYSSAVLAQLKQITGPGQDASATVRDLRDLPWCSIDNDDSRDLDQLTVAESLPNGAVRIRVAIADVDALVPKNSAIDKHARHNTTTVYTSARIFPMLPERLSTDLTSLNPGQDRPALVTEMVFDAQGALSGSTLYRARVHNQAQLAYDAVSEWIDGKAEFPLTGAKKSALEEQIRIQDELAQKLRVRRHQQGSLEFITFQPRAVFEGEHIVKIQEQIHNRARQLIEELMIATNTCTAHFMTQHGVASLRRVVRSPERWLRIIDVAKEYGVALPPEPDGRKLAAFLAQQHESDPERFPDLSLVIIKLMGSGEYVLESPRSTPIGHFGLAVRNYTHSTAPNRRFPDLITLRMLKAVLASSEPPYSDIELAALALHCTKQEDATRKVERKMRKSEAALLLESRIGERFNAIVTGTAMEGVWVRVFEPPVEGKLFSPQPGLAIGDKLKVELVSVSVERGFIDFVAVRSNL
jgi:exoribonuclease-2